MGLPLSIIESYRAEIDKVLSAIGIGTKCSTDSANGRVLIPSGWYPASSLRAIASHVELLHGEYRTEDLRNAEQRQIQNQSSEPTSDVQVRS
jgi:hypothetical protein